MSEGLTNLGLILGNIHFSGKTQCRICLVSLKLVGVRTRTCNFLGVKDLKYPLFILQKVCRWWGSNPQVQRATDNWSDA